MGARIIGAVEIYDALTTSRPYQEKMPPDVAVERADDAHRHARVRHRHVQFALEPCRVRLARDAYTYLHLPMIAGIMLVASGTAGWPATSAGRSRWTGPRGSLRASCAA